MKGLVFSALLTLACLLVSAPGASAQTTAQGVACPNTFTVEHDDHIGALSLPAGPYSLTLVSGELTCAQATQRFTRFLEDFDGVLPGTWTVDAQTATFTDATGDSFNVAPATAPSPSNITPTGDVCAGTFRVLHDDHIGTLKLPAGRYLVSRQGMTCAAADRWLARFLRSESGTLPAPWKLTAATGSFTRPTGGGFRIKPAS